MKLCECGCGDPAPVAARTAHGYIKGESKRFIRGHHMRGMDRGEAFRETMRRRTARGSANHHWRGGRSVTGKGYILLHSLHDHMQANSRGHALEHRVVLAQRLGRPLSSKEIVHHVNQNRSDNRLENLWLFPDRASHTQWHRMEQGAPFVRRMNPIELTGRQT